MEELLNLAKEKGFWSDFVFVDNFKIKHPSNKIGFYLWMCELQKWLIDNHNIHVNITTNLEDETIEYYCNVYTIDRKNLNCEYIEVKYIYEVSLADGLKEALLLIK